MGLKYMMVVFKLRGTPLYSLRGSNPQYFCHNKDVSHMKKGTIALLIGATWPLEWGVFPSNSIPASSSPKELLPIHQKTPKMQPFASLCIESQTYSCFPSGQRCAYLLTATKNSAKTRHLNSHDRTSWPQLNFRFSPRTP